MHSSGDNCFMRECIVFASSSSMESYSSSSRLLSSLEAAQMQRPVVDLFLPFPLCPFLMFPLFLPIGHSCDMCPVLWHMKHNPSLMCLSCSSFDKVLIITASISISSRSLCFRLYLLFPLPPWPRLVMIPTLDLADATSVAASYQS